MKKGFGIFGVVVGIGLLVVGVAGVVGAYYLVNSRDRSTGVQSVENKQDFGQLEKEEKRLTETESNQTPSPTSSSRANNTGGTDALENSGTQTILWEQPEGLYSITLPGGWVVTGTFATKIYSTTKFASQVGDISITFGTGKDPIGGCSEASAVVLADRTISGCYLLQKDGSRLLSRAYTKTAGNLPITIEAYIKAPLAINQQQVVSIIKTIDIK